MHFSNGCLNANWKLPPAKAAKMPPTGAVTVTDANAERRFAGRWTRFTDSRPTGCGPTLTAVSVARSAVAGG